MDNKHLHSMQYHKINNQLNNNNKIHNNNHYLEDLANNNNKQVDLHLDNKTIHLVTNNNNKNKNKFHYKIKYQISHKIYKIMFNNYMD